MRLGDNSEVQRNLNEAAFHAETDLKSKQMKQNIEVSKPLYNILPKLAQPSKDNSLVWSILYGQCPVFSCRIDL